MRHPERFEWLGLEPDVGSAASYRAGVSVWRQSDQREIHEAMRQRLALLTGVYACDCSRREIAGDNDAPGKEPRYPGTCRTLALTDECGRGLRVPMLPGAEAFDDALLGPQRQEPDAQCGDLLIRDRHGCWTYQFCVAVDDWRHEIDLVVRGRDLLDSTGRQIRLARLLGRAAPPVFLHHPLILHADGRKVSKSNHDTGVRHLRAAGLSPAEVLGRAAHAAGLTSEPAPLAADGLASLFA